MMRGRRAVSKADINALLLGIFNPDKPPTFRQDSGIIKAVEQINRELGTNYTINDFINFKGITDIAQKYSQIPLGLSESERLEFLRTTQRGKQQEKVIEPAVKDLQERIRDQRGSLPKPQIPLPNVPMPNVPPLTASVDSTTNLTRTETALLSPTEQIIAARGKGGIMDLV